MSRRAAALFGCAVALAGCELLQAQWGYERIASMTTPADDPGLGCGVTLPVDSAAKERASCSFGSGARPKETLSLEPAVAASIPIRHVVVVMKRSRSFDHLWGALEGPPADYVNLDPSGMEVKPFRAQSTCLSPAPGHEATASRAGLNGGAMDGFVRSAAATTGTDGHVAMAYNDEADLPFTYFLAKTFAINDTHFAALQGGTFANRNFVLFGSNAGIVDTGTAYPAPDTPSLLQQLMNAGFTWGAYSDGLPFAGALGMKRGQPGVYSVQALLDALDAGTLPNVAFVDGAPGEDDDLSPADLQRGEAWLKALYDHAARSPQWQRLAMVVTYDDGGGFADHVAPGSGCPAAASASFTDRGTRVPLAVISPWAKRAFVSHERQDHTAITRFIAALFNLPALTGRDAASGAMLELFDFSCGRDLSVPAAPEPGQGGCSR